MIHTVFNQEAFAPLTLEKRAEITETARHDA
jgi:hypothetical protein